MHSPSFISRKPQTPTAWVPRLILISLWGFIAAGILAAPLLAASGNPYLSRLFYAFYSPVCHQVSRRSFSLAGFSWAVCQRCSGIYLGLFLSCFLPQACFGRAAYARSRRWLIVAAGIPLVADVWLSLLGLWEGTGPTRFMTGFLAGAAINLIVLPAVTEFLFETRRTHFHAQVQQNQGDPP